MAAVRRLALLLALGAAVLLPLSGLGTRLGVWDWRMGLGLMRWAGYIAGAAFIIGAVALSVPRLRGRRKNLLLSALVISFCIVAVPIGFLQRARSVPPIHDISTDTESPPQFVSVVPLRAKAPNPPAYDGAEVAAQQKLAYPDIVPLRLSVPPQAAFDKALRAAQAMGWDIVGADAALGRIEATATTFWFGFKDDVVVRVIPLSGTGCRIDVRSKSRVGRSDLGTNANRVRQFLHRVAAE